MTGVVQCGILSNIDKVATETRSPAERFTSVEDFLGLDRTDLVLRVALTNWFHKLSGDVYQHF